MASSKRTAVVVVSWEWAREVGIRRFFGWSEAKEPRANFIFGPLGGTDERGVWLKDVNSPAVKRKDGQPVVMDLMIPWQAIDTLGVVTEQEATTKAKRQIGFQVDGDITVIGGDTSKSA